MRKLMAISVAVLCALMALAACGGSSSSKSGSSKGGSNSEFTTLSNKAKTARIRVTYNTLDNSGNVSDTWTISQDGTTRSAYITKDSKTVINGDTATSCSDLSTTPSCDTVAGGQAAARSLIAGFTAPFTAAATAIVQAASNNGFGATSNDTIAGRSAECVTITAGSAVGALGNAIAKAAGANTKAGWQTCVDKDTGFVLRYVVVGVDSDKSGLVATEVGDPQDDDFATPTTSTTTAGSGSSDETTTTEAGSGTTGTTAGSCTPPSLPEGVTYPPGISVPCG